MFFPAWLWWRTFLCISILSVSEWDVSHLSQPPIPLLRIACSNSAHFFGSLLFCGSSLYIKDICLYGARQPYLSVYPCQYSVGLIFLFCQFIHLEWFFWYVLLNYTCLLMKLKVFLVCVLGRHSFFWKYLAVSTFRVYEHCSLLFIHSSINSSTHSFIESILVSITCYNILSCKSWHLLSQALSVLFCLLFSETTDTMSGLLSLVILYSTPLFPVPWHRLYEGYDVVGLL